MKLRLELFQSTSALSIKKSFIIVIQSELITKLQILFRSNYTKAGDDDKEMCLAQT